MRNRVLVLAVLVLLGVSSMASARPQFGRMAFVHHNSPSHHAVR